MTPKRKIADGFLSVITSLSAIITVGILVMIMSFLLQNGSGSLSFDMIRSSYWAENKWAISNSNLPENHDLGIEFEDKVDNQGKSRLLVKSIEEDSFFTKLENAVAGEEQGQPATLIVGHEIDRILYLDEKGSLQTSGQLINDDAETLKLKLESATEIKEVFYKTKGGGIWGSLVATLLLIALSILISFPLGIGTALYMSEIAPKNRVTSLMASSIDLLAGVPSIIFGLMGMVVIYPVVAFFKVEGMSIILGSATMAVLLLPVIIRSVLESLKVVPLEQRLASMSLGATDTQTIFRITLPAALPGILSALLLTISRIIGESAALIFTMGTFINDKPKLTEGATSLAVHIWSLMSHEQPNFKLASAISLIILVLVLILNLSIKFISWKLEKRAS